MPKQHIVDRYFKTISNIGVFSDQKGLDYFIDKASEVNCTNLFFNNIITRFLVIVIGGSYFTKKIPLNKLIQISAEDMIKSAFDAFQSQTSDSKLIKDLAYFEPEYLKPYQGKPPVMNK